jgi:UDP-2,3-diacylglucosamine pyrophosphatase LpxH
MWNANEIFVFSDLHLAGKHGRLFQADQELAACFDWIREETYDSVVVIAGDFIDFLATSNNDTTLNFDRLGDQTREIIDHHAEVFRALSALATSDRHNLLILGGNHDPELIFPQVQLVIEQHLGVGNMKPTIRWFVHGEAVLLNVGPAVVLIEHGNVLDPWNRIDHQSLQSAFSLASRHLPNVSHYQPPPGSRLVLEVVNEMRENFHWVDWLKPETEAVLPILMNFASLGQKRLVLRAADDYLNMKMAAFNRKVGNAIEPERLYRGVKEYEQDGNDSLFKEWVDTVNEPERLYRGNGHRDDRLIEKLSRVSARDTFFEIDKLDDPSNYLQPVFKGGADLVIHGHTHSAKMCALEGGLYINTGTWAQLLSLPKSYESASKWEEFLGQLKTNSVEGRCRPTLAHVKYNEKNNQTTAHLLEWRERGAHALDTRQFKDRATGWHREVPHNGSP